MAKKTLGVLTSGGDCAGLNAAIRAVVLHGSALGYDIIGIKNGAHGLMSLPPQIEYLTPENCAPGLIRQGGTFLGTTNKGDPFAWLDDNGASHDRSKEFVNSVKALNLDGLVGIGGDGSLQILHRLCALAGIGLVGIPKTIDNDVAETEICLGFDTAVEIATEALDRLQPTAASHDRLMILEVMGRDAGHIALHAGIAGGADIILIPEINYDLQKIANKIRSLQKTGRNFALMIVSEAVKWQAGATEIRYGDGQKRYGGIGYRLAEEITKLTGAETRVTLLGHVQRGAAPTAYDRIIGSAFGVHAVDLIDKKHFNRLVVWRERQVIDVELTKAISSYRTVQPDDSLIRTARALGICLGD